MTARAAAAPLHLVSAWATGERLVLAQEAVDEKENECAAIPDLLDPLALDGALVTIDAIACNPAMATAIGARGGNYLLAVEANQPTLLKEITACFEQAPADELASHVGHDKGHGRTERRRYAVSQTIDWLGSNRRYPGEPRFPDLKSIARVKAEVEQAGATTRSLRYYLSSATLSPERLAHAVRGHWGIENGLHRVLDVVFRDDQSRLRRGHGGARNMAIVRHFAINLVRLGKDNRSIKTTRKLAGWKTAELARLLSPPPC
jgi:predicted transposase YbfD/YdcC